MKKIISVLVLVVMVAGIAGCSFGTPANVEVLPTPEATSVATPENEVETTPTPEESEVPTPAPEKKISASDIFAELPESFYFSSGVGGWWTEIAIDEDGSFEGKFQDSEMGSVGDGYPNGTIFYCDFKGKFSAPEKVDGFSYKMSLESLTLGEPEGKEYIEDEVLYKCSGPYGLEDGKTFMIYMPGAPVDKLPEGFMSWANGYTDIGDHLPADFYGLYNVEAECGFGGFMSEL